MSHKTIYKTCYGICPLSDTEESLIATYKSVAVIGQNQTPYRLVSASCNSDNAINCPLGNNCPILSSVEEVTYE